MNGRSTPSPNFLYLLAFISLILAVCFLPVAFQSYPSMWGFVLVLGMVIAGFVLFFLGLRSRKQRDEAREASVAPTKEELASELNTRLHFDEADLQANREGQMTEHQRNNQFALMHANVAFAERDLFYPIGVFLFYALIGFIFSGGQMNLKDKPLLVIFTIGLGLNTLYSLKRILAMRPSPDKEIKVSVAEGQTQVDKGRSWPRQLYLKPAYFSTTSDPTAPTSSNFLKVSPLIGSVRKTTILRVDKERLLVSPDQGSAFWNGSRYRIYFTREGLLTNILSAEPLDQPSEISHRYLEVPLPEGE